MERGSANPAAAKEAAVSPVAVICLRLFQPGDEVAFRSLNEEWIEKYFGLEEEDRTTLNDPAGQILRPGGRIVIALAESGPIGCCALRPISPGVYDIAKMAVAESHRGHGIGRKVLEYAIAQAKALGARRLYLETNSRLANAVHLYESVGFRHLPPERVTPSAYARANVYMEMLL